MPKNVKTIGGNDDDGDGENKERRYRSKPRGGRGRGRGKGKNQEADNSAEDSNGMSSAEYLSKAVTTKLKRQISIEIPDAAGSSSMRMHPYSGRLSATKIQSLKSPGGLNGITPTGQLVMSMASYCLDSPAFGTRNRVAFGSESGFAAEVPDEVTHAVKWWADAVHGTGCVDAAKAKTFKDSLQKDLEFRCCYHWYPLSPQKGSGYRSIVNGVKMDDALKRACQVSGVAESALPRPRIMFVNPGEVKVQGKNDEMVETVYIGGVGASSGGKGSRSGLHTTEERRANNPFVQKFAMQLAAQQSRASASSASAKKARGD